LSVFTLFVLRLFSGESFFDRIKPVEAVEVVSHSEYLKEVHDSKTEAIIGDKGILIVMLHQLLFGVLDHLDIASGKGRYDHVEVLQEFLLLILIGKASDFLYHLPKIVVSVISLLEQQTN
jgi:hypothetical protein